MTTKAAKIIIVINIDQIVLELSSAFFDYQNLMCAAEPSYSYTLQLQN